ncbi:MAG: DNA repair protein RecO [Balneolales bacterium]|nr:DNA repair protein RecO [Balneolales bacterium]
MIVTTPAIVLKAIDFQESSRIVTLLTPDHGKMAVMVRGVRKPKSKFAGYFEVGKVLDIVVYIKTSRTIQNISEASFRQRNWQISQDFPKLALVMATMEMLDQLVHDNESSRDFFEMAEKFIDWLNHTEDDVANVFPYMLLRLAELSGVGIHYSTEIENSEVASESLFLNIEEGVISKSVGIGLSFKLSDIQANYLIQLLAGKKVSVFRNPIPRSELKLLIHHLDVYLQHHIEGLRGRRSDAIFEQIL